MRVRSKRVCRTAPALFNMTTYGYLVVMKTRVRISELKSRLSEYLRRVRRGETITVLDRDTPVARLEPILGEASRLVVREPAAGAPRLRDLRMPAPLKTKTDILDVLAEERGER